MSFEPNEWRSGDTVTSAHLNRIEQGIAEAAKSGGGLFFIDGIIVEENEEGGGEK